MFNEIKSNKARHLILEKLHLKEPKPNLESTLKKTVNITEAGLSFKEIDLILKNKNLDRELILSDLFKSEEIIFSDSPEYGCFIHEDNGRSALSNRKYIKRNNNIILNWFKAFTQIAIPILSLIITIIALTLKANNLNSKTTLEIQALNQKVKSIQSSINLFKNEDKNSHVLTDSLHIK